MALAHRLEMLSVRLSLTLIMVVKMAASASADAQTATDTTPPGKRVNIYLNLSGTLAESYRSERLRDSAASIPLLRSPSSMSRFDVKALAWVYAVLPSVDWVVNGGMPHSLNDGALWAGRGTNVRVIGGAIAGLGRLRLLLAPEAVWSSNSPYDVTYSPRFPVRPAARSPWSSPFHTAAQSIDLPIRFGNGSRSAVTLGQSSLFVDLGRISLGGATENNWWGPGQKNALIVSDNAEGFPHIFLRTSRPLDTPIGALEVKWHAGWLEESEFFDSDPAGLRAISMFGASLQPTSITGLTIGVARSVYAPTNSRAKASVGLLKVFQDVGTPNAVAFTDTTFAPGPDQLFSLFARWAFPQDGLEVYAEWGRAEFPRSLRDYLEQPNHTQAYTLGLQWISIPMQALRGRLRAQGEVSYLQQSTTYRFRPLGSWYTSRAVPQGYTHKGQVIGAAIGPGSSSQWVALDDVTTKWSAGLFVNRIRWLEDARSQAFVGTVPGNGWCEHDTNLIGGVRAAWNSKLGTLSGSYATGWRYNVFFKHQPNNCPFSTGTDIRVRNLSISFTPYLR